MIFADVARDQGATFVDCAAKNGVTADAHARTARCFLGQIFSRDFPFHTPVVSDEKPDSAAKHVDKTQSMQLPQMRTDETQISRF